MLLRPSVLLPKPKPRYTLTRLPLRSCRGPPLKNSSPRQIQALALELSTVKVLELSSTAVFDDKDKALAEATAAVLASDSWGVGEVAHLADLGEADVRRAAQAAGISVRHANRLVKLWAQVVGDGQVATPPTAPAIPPENQ